MLREMFGVNDNDFDEYIRRDFASSSAPSVNTDTGAERKSFSATLSDGRVDRMGDVVSVDGIDLSHYRKNPVVLWQHNSHRPIGRATSIGVSNGALRATAELATSASGDAAHAARLIGAGVIRAVSIGFVPGEMSYDHKRQGFNFTKSELLEFSCVSVPALPSALIEGKTASQARRERELDRARMGP